MFQLKFELLEAEGEDISVFELGYSTLTTDKHEMSSRNFGGSSMIFLDLSSYIDGLRGLIKNDDWQTCEFYSHNSSFSFTFVRKKQKVNELKLFYRGDFMQSVQTQEVLHAFWIEANRFIEEYQDQISKSRASGKEKEYDDIWLELYKSIEDFGKFLGEN